AALLVEALDQLVTVPGRFVQDGEQRRADVASAHPAAPLPAAAAHLFVEVPGSAPAVSWISHSCVPFVVPHGRLRYIAMYCDATRCDADHQAPAGFYAADVS